MTRSGSPKHTDTLRRWQQRLAHAAILVSIAAGIALAWSLLAGSGDGQADLILTHPTPALVGSSASPSASASGGSESMPADLSASSGQSGSSLPKVSSDDDIPVYLVGAVVRPDVYIVRRGSYLYELIALAGGMTPDAAASSVNLALKLTENQMIRIPTQAEADDPLNPNPLPASASAGGQKTVNINTATQEELETLPGIGPATAAAIIADRKKNGPFASPQDIMRVTGVKESRFEQLEALIRVR